MKVLFLDIDGVLNRIGTKERCGRWTGVDRELSTRLTDWLKANPDIQVVLSSTWRNHPDMHQHLKDAGISWVDITPEHASRGLEIQWYLDDHPEIAEYVILDDMDVLSLQKHRHVQTDERHGLSEDKLTELASLFQVSLHSTRETDPSEQPSGAKSECQPPEVKEATAV